MVTARPRLASSRAATRRSSRRAAQAKPTPKLKPNGTATKTGIAGSRARRPCRGNTCGPLAKRHSQVTTRPMDRSRLTQLLQAVSTGQLDVAAALSQLSELPFSDISYARVDHHRALRQGMPEVVFAPGKSVEQI